MGIYDKPCLRQTIERIFYRLRVGCPWRDLPGALGNRNAVYKSAKGVRSLIYASPQAQQNKSAKGVRSLIYASPQAQQNKSAKGVRSLIYASPQAQQNKHHK